MSSFFRNNTEVLNKLELILKQNNVLITQGETIKYRINKLLNQGAYIMSADDDVKSKLAVLTAGFAKLEDTIVAVKSAIAVLIAQKGDPVLTAAVNDAMSGLDVASARLSADHDALAAVVAVSTASGGVATSSQEQNMNKIIILSVLMLAGCNLPTPVLPGAPTSVACGGLNKSACEADAKDCWWHASPDGTEECRAGSGLTK